MKRRAFTLLEIIIGIGILAILGTIASPTFNVLIYKSKEGTTKGGLATIRGAISVYHSDNDEYPTDDLTSLCKGGKYLVKLPVTRLPNTPHSASRHVYVSSGTADKVTDVGGWAYDNDPNSPEWGTVRVNCVHTNTVGETWSQL